MSGATDGGVGVGWGGEAGKRDADRLSTMKLITRIPKHVFLNTSSQKQNN